MARPAISLSVLNETVLRSDLTESSKKHLSYCTEVYRQEGLFSVL
jgi:hypothetical protein